MPSTGICVFVTEDSGSLNYVKVGDSVKRRQETQAQLPPSRVAGRANGTQRPMPRNSTNSLIFVMASGK
jgi:hypothetical protein